MLVQEYQIYDMKLTRIPSTFFLVLISAGVLIAGRKGALNLVVVVKGAMSFWSEPWRVEEGIVAPGWAWVVRLSSDSMIVLFRSTASESLVKASQTRFSRL